VLSKLAEHCSSHHFAQSFAEADGGDFWLFGSTIEPKGSIVEPTVNALTKSSRDLREKYHQKKSIPIKSQDLED
jgi:hypothetical protein